MTSPAAESGSRGGDATGAAPDGAVPGGAAPAGAGERQRVPFGLWPSPLSARMAAQGGARFGGLAVSRDRTGRALIWYSALDDGSNVVWVARPDGVPRKLVAVTSARSRVNEYGGGAFWVHGETLFWVEDDDQRIRRLDLGDAKGCLVDRKPDQSLPAPGVEPAEPQATEPPVFELRVEQTGEGIPLVGDPPARRSIRYAAGVVEPGGAWMVVERELHAEEGGVVNDLVWIPTGLADSHPTASLPSGVHSIVSGCDFVVAPTLSPDGHHLAWMQWNHPDMPWDAAELWAGHLRVSPEGPAVEGERRIAGGAAARSGDHGLPPVAVCLPEWDHRGRLWWCDDRDDPWLLRHAPEPGLPSVGSGDSAPANGGAAGEVGTPRWISGGSRYGFVGSDLVIAETVDGLDRIVGGGVDPGSVMASPGWVDTLVVGTITDRSSGETAVVVAVAGSPTEPTAVTCATTGSGAATVSRFHARPWPLPVGSISEPEAITFATGPGVLVGDSAGQADRTSVAPVAHGLFYPPALEGFAGPDADRPPLVVRIHGGPTANARAELSASVQFWTTRGFAVVDVNYRGSTGYGRAFRDQLRGGWGEVEVQDCIAAAEFLASQDRVDAERCVIRGGSAGGFTALEAVAADPTASGFHFAAAVTLYGVTDLMALADDTHKFESRYLDGLIGPLPGAEDVYRQRSPLSHPERISAPVLVLQGLDDPVVPPSQAEELVAGLADAGIDHEYRTYEGEGHGFRNQETVVDALETELAFYQRVLGLSPAS